MNANGKDGLEATVFDPGKRLGGVAPQDVSALWSYWVSYHFQIVGMPISGFGSRHLYSPAPIGEVQDMELLKQALQAEVQAAVKVQDPQTGALLLPDNTAQVQILNIVALRRPIVPEGSSPGPRLVKPSAS